jgi:pyrimidine deaminase RibD-like protein
VIVGVDSRRDFERACKIILTASEPEKVIARISEPDYLITGNGEYADKARNILSDCLRLLHEQAQKEKPWKISEDFISDLGKL